MTNANNETVVLGGDIGGTKTNLGLFFKGARRPLLKKIETYSSQEAPNLEHIIDKFLKRHKVTIASGCFGVAGPVLNGRSKITNLPWDVSEARIKRRFKWEHVRLINDLAATAVAIPLLNNREFLSLNRAKTRKGDNLALIAPGTGLGQALLIFQDGKYVPVPSEGGHGDFSPNNEAEVRLWRYLHERYGHVSIERVVSGSGLLNIYSWLKDSEGHREPEWLTKKLSGVDPARAISEAAINDKEPLCVATLDLLYRDGGTIEEILFGPTIIAGLIVFRDTTIVYPEDVGFTPGDFRTIWFFHEQSVDGSRCGPTRDGHNKSSIFYDAIFGRRHEDIGSLFCKLAQIICNDYFGVNRHRNSFLLEIHNRLHIKPLPAKAGRFLLRLKVICYEPQNSRTRNPGPDLVYPDLTIEGQTCCSNTSNY